MVGILENPEKTVEKMAKNGLENNGVYIIWKIRGNTAREAIIPNRHNKTPQKPREGGYFGGVDTLQGYEIKSLYGAINALETRIRFLQLL